MSRKLNFLDLFAGAGGLSEGFIRAGFNSIAHVEMDLAACYTLRTRMAFHWLNKCGNGESYCKYLNHHISRTDLYAQVPKTELDSVINSCISQDNLQSIFDRIDRLMNGEKLDLIIGGPPCQAYSLVGRSRSRNRMKKDITTGSVVKEKTTEQPFVVLSPPCDLVIRGENGKSNTNRILLVEIESVNDALDGRRNKNSVASLVKNNRQYFHWLPLTHFFEGGVLNFRKLNTLTKDEFEENFEKPAIQISPSFVKDIVARFSSYYARQGQPDIDSSDFVTRYVSWQQERNK